MLIQNDKLLIRNSIKSDSKILCKWWNDGEVMSHAGFPNGLGTSCQEIEEQIGKNTDETGRRLIIEYDNNPIGEMSYSNQGSDVAEIGIKICDSSKQEKGLGTTILRLLIKSLFDEYKFEKIILDTNLNNKRAQHVYEKIGFTKVKVSYDS